MSTNIYIRSVFVPTHRYGNTGSPRSQPTPSRHLLTTSRTRHGHAVAIRTARALVRPTSDRPGRDARGREHVSWRLTLATSECGTKTNSLSKQDHFFRDFLLYQIFDIFFLRIISRRWFYSDLALLFRGRNYDIISYYLKKNHILLSKNLLQNGTITFLFVFNNYCLIIN